MDKLKFKRIEPLKKKYSYIGTFDELNIATAKKKPIVANKKKNIRIPNTNKKPIIKNIGSFDSLTVTGRENNIPWVDAEINYGDRGNNMRCVVVIPVYKPFGNLKAEDKGSIKQVIKILGNKYDLVLIYPEGLDIHDYNVDGYKFSSLMMNSAFFKRQKTYSDLCERWEFYNSFKEYEYMLIYQTDAWIFEDRLEEFMNKGYDYIGGAHLLKSNGEGGENGNGGLSLRVISKFIDVCKSVDWKKVPIGQLEDCAFTQRFKNMFKLAPIETSLAFSWHEKASMCFKRCKGVLPMGCHAFKKHDYRFWSKYISF